MHFPGVQYYSGKVSVRETVGVLRDLQNKLDPTALKVVNSQNQQVGNILHEQSQFLAPLVDQQIVRIEGVVTESAVYSIPLKLLLYGRPEHHMQVLDVCRVRQNYLSFFYFWLKFDRIFYF